MTYNWNIPGTPVFGGQEARKGYALNTMCFSFNDAANQLVWTEDGSAVADVMIAGQWKLRDGKVLGLDEAKLARDAQAAADRLREANAGIRAWCEEVAPHVAWVTGGTFERSFTKAAENVRRLGTGEALLNQVI